MSSTLDFVQTMALLSQFKNNQKIDPLKMDLIELFDFILDNVYNYQKPETAIDILNIYKNRYVNFDVEIYEPIEDVLKGIQSMPEKNYFYKQRKEEELKYYVDPKNEEDRRKYEEQYKEYVLKYNEAQEKYFKNSLDSINSIIDLFNEIKEKPELYLSKYYTDKIGKIKVDICNTIVDYENFQRLPYEKTPYELYLDKKNSAEQKLGCLAGFLITIVIIAGLCAYWNYCANNT